MTDVILIVICYLVIGLFIAIVGDLILVFSDFEYNDEVDFLLVTCVLWPVLILIIVIKFIISITKAIKEYVKFLIQLLNK